MISRTYLLQKKSLLVLLILVLGLIGLAVLDPLLQNSKPGTAHFIHELFAPVCHQMPDRSFYLYGFPLGFCVRCTGIYIIGALLVIISLFRNEIRMFPLYIYCWGAFPLIADFSLEKIGLYFDVILIRFITGGLFGFFVFHLLIIAISLRIDEAQTGVGEKEWIINRL